MEITTSREGTILKVNLNGRLTFTDNSAFQSILPTPGTTDVEHINLNLGDLDYIDSSGIGMLLVLKEKCDEVGANMTMSHPRGQVEKVLRVACIDRVIPIVG